MSQDAAHTTSEFIYRIRPARPEMLTIGPTATESAWIDQHFTYLKDLTERGIVQLAGRTLNTDPTCFGIVIFRVETEEAARLIMENDPAVQNGVMRAELFPFRTALQGGRRVP